MNRRHWLDRWRWRLSHPSAGRLVQWLDGELESGLAVGVAEHLRWCRLCRNRAKVFSTDLTRLPATPDPAPPHLVDEARRRLLAALAQRQAAVTPDETAARLADELSPLFGDAVAEWLANLEAQGSRAEIALRAEPLIASFLGRESAARALHRLMP